MTESDDVVAQALGRPDPFKGLKAGTTADVVARALGRAPSGPDEWMESSLRAATIMQAQPTSMRPPHSISGWPHYARRSPRAA